MKDDGLSKASAYTLSVVKEAIEAKEEEEEEEKEEAVKMIHEQARFSGRGKDEVKWLSRLFWQNDHHELMTEEVPFP